MKGGYGRPRPLVSSLRTKSVLWIRARQFISNEIASERPPLPTGDSVWSSVFNEIDQWPGNGHAKLCTRILTPTETSEGNQLRAYFCPRIESSASSE